MQIESFELESLINTFSFRYVKHVNILLNFVWESYEDSQNYVKLQEHIKQGWIFIYMNK